ncbi:hypothetical protein PABG_06198 [Paracoccidioides brasiliensis Pb03]|nr:hypothetical protein PABG_06198 [Paracoccidioides brasiliensis Pb03]
MAEGGFNRDFPLTMDDGSRVLERTPSLLVAGSRAFPNCWQSDGPASWWLSLVNSRPEESDVTGTYPRFEQTISPSISLRCGSPYYTKEYRRILSSSFASSRWLLAWGPHFEMTRFWHG